MPTSTASAVWEGVLRTGRGHFTAGSKAFEGDYTFKTRFEGAKGTNPEELIAAAARRVLQHGAVGGAGEGRHAGDPDLHDGGCTVEKVGDGFKITKMRLETRGEVPGLDQAGFVKAAEGAKEGCPVSGALKGNVQLELDARLA